MITNGMVDKRVLDFAREDSLRALQREKRKAGARRRRERETHLHSLLCTFTEGMVYPCDHGIVSGNRLDNFSPPDDWFNWHPGHNFQGIIGMP